MGLANVRKIACDTAAIWICLILGVRRSLQVDW
jgi:hypothetical protein